jgi:hypothetical protein
MPAGAPEGREPGQLIRRARRALDLEAPEVHRRLGPRSDAGPDARVRAERETAGVEGLPDDERRGGIDQRVQSRAGGRIADLRLVEARGLGRIVPIGDADVARRR